MTRNVSSFSVLMLFACISLVGFWLIPRLNVQPNNTRTSSSLRVNYSWGNASPKVMEQDVTSKLEGVFSTLEGLKNISSVSGKGSGYIDVEFTDDIDMDITRFEMATLIRQVYPKLPNGVSFPVISNNILDTDTKPILSYSITSSQSPYYVDRQFRNNVLPQFSGIKGLSDIELFGVHPYIWKVTYNSSQLSALKISVAEVADAINKHIKIKEVGNSSFRPNPEKQEIIVSLNLTYNTDDTIAWDLIPIKKVNGRTVYLGNIASTKIVEDSTNKHYRINGIKTINMMFYPDKDANVIVLSNRIQAMVQEIKGQGQFDYTIRLVRDHTDYLMKELRHIQYRALFSLIILLLLTVVVYREFKYLVVLFLGLAANLLFAVIIYYFCEVNLHIYSFAGITISFGIMIDNGIIMMDHVRKNGNKKAFLAILASSLTTIGAVWIIFWENENQWYNIYDLILVLAINIVASLLVTYFLLPALMEKFKIGSRPIHRKGKRGMIMINRYYSKVICFLRRPKIKKWPLIVILLAFGIPIHLTPDKVEGENYWYRFYNDAFVRDIKPPLEKIIGGSFRLFTENVFENSSSVQTGRTTLKIIGAIDSGAGTMEQLDRATQKLERFISRYDGIDFFETNIISNQNAQITIYFNESEHDRSFPFVFKSMLESEAIKLGGVNWYISGIGRPFTNSTNSEYKSEQIILQGYDYEELLTYAQNLVTLLKKTSLGRAHDVEVVFNELRGVSNYEYNLTLDLNQFSNQVDIYQKVNNVLNNKMFVGYLNSAHIDNGNVKVKLTSDLMDKMDLWVFNNSIIKIGSEERKIKEMGNIEKRRRENDIKKFNQQYRLMVGYDFLGPRDMADKFRKSKISDFSKTLPVGYQVLEHKDVEVWDKTESSQYYYLILIGLIIYFICAILLESYYQPFVVITMIPISLMGAFLTFYIFDLNFDQGGYASFILLSGLSVNSSLYVINDYNNLRMKFNKQTFTQTYIRAFNNKITPVLLTLASTIVGLLPFLWGGTIEVFWFSFAAGSIGGLTFSLLGLFIYLPLLLR